MTFNHVTVIYTYLIQWISLIVALGMEILTLCFSSHL